MASSRWVRLGRALAACTTLAIGLIVGFKLVRPVSSTSHDSDVPGLTRGMVYATYDAEGGLVPVAAKGVQVQDPTKPLRMLVWSQPNYEGEITEDTVRKLVKLGKASALEARLGSKARGRFRQEVRESERELRAFSQLFDSELLRVKDALRQRPDRHIIIRANPRTADPRWPEVVEQERQLNQPLVGLVVGDALAPRDSAIIYYLIHWTEWPLLERLNERFHGKIRARERVVTRWIEEEFKRGGVEAFRGS